MYPSILGLLIRLIYWKIFKRQKITTKKKTTESFIPAYKNFHVSWNALKYLSQRKMNAKTCLSKQNMPILMDTQYSLYPFPAWKWQTLHCFLTVCSGIPQTFLSRGWAVNRAKSTSILGLLSECFQKNNMSLFVIWGKKWFKGILNTGLVMCLVIVFTTRST